MCVIGNECVVAIVVSVLWDDDRGVCGEECVVRERVVERSVLCALP